MDWVLRSPQLHSLFGSLGFVLGDTYHISENCNAALKSILDNIFAEDKYLRSFRRSISLGRNIERDIIPLLLHTNDDRTIELIIEILVNLTIPIECLLSVEVICNTDFGRLTVIELSNLLATTKVAFTDHRATKPIIEFLKKNLEVKHMSTLTTKQCNNISNSLLLLRNILHIPEDVKNITSNHSTTGHACQNKIIWNIFSQGIDKHLIKLMNIPESHNWGVTMVQLIALLYKDQHVVNLQKLLNMWLEASLSESSDDNESNTSPPDRRSEDSSPILTSDPTSDSSDAGGSGKIDEPCEWAGSGDSSCEGAFPAPPYQEEEPVDHVHNDVRLQENISLCSSMATERKSCSDSGNSANVDKKVKSESFDGGYGTQIETQEVSTSSNDDELPDKKPLHQKLYIPKQRVIKPRLVITTQEKNRKKIVKRGKANILNVQGLLHQTPSNDDISHVLKEFTVDFLLKGYNSLVQTLYTQILTNVNLEIDISHFLWLITYFLKFATQIELDLEHLDSVLSYDIVSYLTFEGVNLCEQFELALKLDGNDLKPSIRRQHLVVTAIREFIQAVEAYKKYHIDEEDTETLLDLQKDMCNTEELRSMFVLLIRSYNQEYHSKQYLQDLIVTNHFLLMFLDNTTKIPEFDGSFNMTDHIRQFAVAEIMAVYGILLEDYTSNGEFVNDCIFTLMYHVSGELSSLPSLFQPVILRSFTSIWESEFEICDDWSDLMEYVINMFIKKRHTSKNLKDFKIHCKKFEQDLGMIALPIKLKPICIDNNKKKVPQSSAATALVSKEEKWTDDELSFLNWNYMQCKSKSDVIGELVRLFKEDKIEKTRLSVINELFTQDIINKQTYEEYTGKEKSSKVVPQKENRDDEVGKLCEQLEADGKGAFLVWVQKVLFEICYVKLLLNNIATSSSYANDDKPSYISTTSPVSYHCLQLNQSIPLVTWNCEQAVICKDLKFLQLLNKLGFYMPVDSDKVFIRIPFFWTADALFNIACKISSKQNVKLKLKIQDLSNCTSTEKLKSLIGFEDSRENEPEINNLYQVQERSKLPSAMNFTPNPGTSFNTSAEDKAVADAEPNWLQVVRRSHDMGLGMKRELSEFVPPLPPPPRVAPPPPLEPATPLAQVGFESDNNSVCDTASVASDLTRMYVSDEEDKPEPPLRSSELAFITPDLADTLDESDETECNRAGKRVCHRRNDA